MASEWLLISSGVGDPAFNMGLDEALLVLSSRLGRPVLRFYGWSKPAATFGYFQSIQRVETLTTLRPLIRRPTGGGLVPHDQDWTYSLVFPPADPWYRLRAKESYRALHEWLRSAWLRLGVETGLAPRLAPGAGCCFVGAEINDLLWQGRKIAGAAQRRNQQGLLIQGSQQNLPPGTDRIHWERSACDVLREQWQADGLPLEVEGELLDLARQLTQSKYATESFNRRR